MSEEAVEAGVEASESGDERYEPEAMEAGNASSGQADVNLELVLDVQVSLSLRVGQTSISIRDLVSLAEGSVVALDRPATEPLDVMVNGTLVAHGEIVVVDGQFGVRLTDVISPAERIKTLA
ncbi:MAG: flagellar motor switch protein FliN [Pseudomonadota bacterium]